MTHQGSGTGTGGGEVRRYHHGDLAAALVAARS